MILNVHLIVMVNSSTRDQNNDTATDTTIIYCRDTGIVCTTIIGAIGIVIGQSYINGLRHYSGSIKNDQYGNISE